MSHAPRRIAVIGGGIAGFGAAYALDLHGDEVHVFEREASVGGNAKTLEWSGAPQVPLGATAASSAADAATPTSSDSSSVATPTSSDSTPTPAHSTSAATPTSSCSSAAATPTPSDSTPTPSDSTSSATTPWVSGLSVLAWPDKYFHNYNALLARLGIATEHVRVRFMLARAGTDGADFLAHEEGGARGPLAERFAGDLDKWDRLISFVARINALFSRSSLYDVSLLNPLCFVSLRLLAALFGVSAAFWNAVFVSVHSSSFLTTALDGVPAMLLPVLEDMISLRSGGTLTTWTGTSREVFARMSARFSSRVFTGCEVTGVYTDVATGQSTVSLASGAVRGPFDAVIFACNAAAIVQALSPLSSLEAAVLGRIEYVEAHDSCFVEGFAHGDTAVLPARHRRDVCERYSNYIEYREDASHWDNTFVVSSWAPCLREAKSERAMLVSYNSPRVPSSFQLRVTNRLAHPVMDARGMVLAFMVPLFQGRLNRFYCGSYCTPGNGHDLSLLSGFVAASRLGAPHPFADDANCARDFAALKGLMKRSPLLAPLRGALYAAALLALAGWGVWAQQR